MQVESVLLVLISIFMMATSCIDETEELPFLRTGEFSFSPVNFNSLAVSATIEGLEMGEINERGFILADEATNLFLDNSQALVTAGKEFKFEQNLSTFFDTLINISIPPRSKKLRAYLIYRNDTIYGNAVDVTFGDGWEMLHSEFLAIARPAATVIDNDLFIGLGCGVFCDDKTNKSEFWRYKLETNTLELLNEFPGPFRQYAFTSHLGESFFYGGGEIITDGRRVLFRDFWEFIPAGSGEWIKREDFPGVPRSGAISFAIDGKIYVGLGVDTLMNALSDMHCYDPDNGKWSAVTYDCDVGAKIARSQATGLSIAGGGYLLLGQRHLVPLRDVWEFNPTISSCPWTFVTTLPGGMSWRDTPAVFQIANKAYIVAGIDFSQNYYNDVWEFDPAKPQNQFIRRTDFSGKERSEALGFSVDGIGYVAGGISRQSNGQLIALSDLWKYIPTE